MNALRAPTLATILIVTTVTLAIGYASKQGCFALGLGDSFYCFSDYGPVYLARELAGGRFPYSSPPIEYPVGTGLVIWLASALSSSATHFMLASVAVAAAAAFATSALLWREVNGRALYFAAAPSLAFYAFLNWDLAALVFAVAAIAAFLRRRDALAGVLVGAGASMKVFPILLLLPFVAERLRAHDRRAAWRIAAAIAGTIAAFNIPVAWVSFDGWVHFFRFNSSRPVDWGTLWSAGCETFGWLVCRDIPLVNGLSAAACAAGSLVTWVVITRGAPGLPRWQLAFPLFVIFFLTNKVYSPQYSLWVLPWFAFVLPDFRWFVAYEAVDLGIYVTGFGWQQHLASSGGLPLWPLHVSVAVRAALLVAMLIAFARRSAALYSVPATK